MRDHKANPKDDPLKADFRNFLYVVWKHLNLPDPTPVQYDIATYLQHGPKRCIIEAFRGVGKSYVTSAYVVWLLYCNPDHKILVVSASKSRADDFTTFTMRLIKDMPLLQHLVPRKDQRDSKISFDVGPARADHSPSVKSVGITGQLAGSRADTIIADDIEIPNNSATQTMRDKLSESVKEFDAVLKPGGRIIYLGTPQTEQSLYNELPNRGYHVRIWPARVPTPEQVAGYGDRLSPFIMDMVDAGEQPGTPTDPRRFDDDDLFEREASYGRAGFALQFMLDTRLSDAERYPLKLSDLIVMGVSLDLGPMKLAWASSPELSYNDIPNVGFNGDRYYRPMFVDKEWAEYTGTVMAIDPSGRGADETGYAVVKFLNGYLFVVAAGGIQGGYSETTLTKLAETAKKFGVNHIVVEANFGDGMWTELFKPILNKIHPCMVEEIKHQSNKEARIIDTLEPVMMRHKLVIDPKVIDEDYRSVSHHPPEKQNHYRLMYQMTRITRDRGSLAHDDRLDALAMAVGYWVRYMARDDEEGIKARQEEAFQKELDKFMEAAGRTTQNRLRWVQV